MRIKKKNFLPFKEAREIARSLKLMSQAEWFQYCAGKTHWGKRDPRLPTSPYNKYQHTGWINWGDWLGVPNSHRPYKRQLSYNEAEKIIHALGLKNRKDWMRFHDAIKKGNEYKGRIPLYPESCYHNRGWKGWRFWLGVESTQCKEYLPYAEARKFARSLGLRSAAEWREYRKRKLPKGIPVAPDSVYKRRKEWIDWGDYLGTGNISHWYRKGKRKKPLCTKK